MYQNFEQTDDNFDLLGFIETHDKLYPAVLELGSMCYLTRSISSRKMVPVNLASLQQSNKTKPVHA